MTQDELTEEQIQQAARILADRECSNHGHDFDIRVMRTGAPAAIVCQKCGQLWAVQP